MREMSSLQVIVEKLLRSPGSQFHIYARCDVVPGRQREIVSYKTASRRGFVRRSTMSSSRGVLLDCSRLYETILADCQHFCNYYYTFMAAPVFGLTSVSENHSYLPFYQELMPQPLSHLVRCRLEAPAVAAF